MTEENTMTIYSVHSPCIDGNTTAQAEDNIIFKGKQLLGEFFEDRDAHVQYPVPAPGGR